MDPDKIKNLWRNNVRLVEYFGNDLTWILIGRKNNWKNNVRLPKNIGNE